MENRKKFHFLGVGGVSMAALAQYLAKNGHQVTGSDINPNVQIDGIDTTEKNKFFKIKNADIIVATSAIKDDDADLMLAKNLNKKILSRGELLGKIAGRFNNVIAISGTHGKTTTTEMLAEVFMEAGLNPTVHIGGDSKSFGGAFRFGGKQFFITEACEYSGSFLHLKPDVAVILNIEPEHLDFFKTFTNEQKAFKKFAQKSGFVVAPQSTNLGVVSFGENGVFQAAEIKKWKNGYAFWVKKREKKLFYLKINSFSKKNIENALAVIAVCEKFGLETVHIKNALKNFKGVKRRNEVWQEKPLVIHDYAHHPTEIKNQIQSAKAFFNKKVAVVFQPHTYSRTKTLFEDFVSALCLADKLMLLPTFAAREPFDKEGSCERLFEEIKKHKPNVWYYLGFKDAKFRIQQQFKGCVVLVLGAGDINKLWES